MNQYVTGSMIRRLREERGLTQAELAQQLSVSDKAVSKWETGKGYPDISLLEPLAAALQISLIELISGSDITNRNRTCNMRRIKFYVCPVCGNVIIGTGESVISCCGITLPPLEAEEPDEEHRLNLERVEDEYYATLNHEMTKQHSISFLAVVRDNGYDFIKFYPEGNAEARIRIGRLNQLYWYCNRHGLFRMSKIR